MYSLPLNMFVVQPEPESNAALALVVRRMTSDPPHVDAAGSEHVIAVTVADPERQMTPYISFFESVLVAVETTLLLSNC